MSIHVSYWLERGLRISRRIASMTRRFGGSSDLGAWEVFGLFQGEYLSTVYYVSSEPDISCM